MIRLGINDEVIIIYDRNNHSCVGYQRLGTKFYELLFY